MPSDPRQFIRELAALDFAGKGEAFVESRFLTPLLECLGYETHKDYEVIRHGDDGSSFKLHYPPVENGAQRVKHYNPDYVPTIRKKMFWVIEAKSPKDIVYPFEAKYLVQGFQYCVHPEIQAKYLLVTNGSDSAVYDAHGAIFFEKEIYQPILEFKSSDLLNRWEEIFNLLAVETLRTRIETDLKAMYDKLCLSSLDKYYPQTLLRQIGASAGANAKQIEQHVRTLYLQGLDEDQKSWLHQMEQLSAQQVFDLMDWPLRLGPRSEGQYFVEKSLAAGVSAQGIFTKLTENYDQQRMFRKIQAFLALCHLYRRTDDEAAKTLCRKFFDRHKDADLPLLSQVECALLRLVRKTTVLQVYPPVRQKLQKEMETAPELIRFVNPPTAFSQVYPFELMQNALFFEKIRVLTEEQLQALLTGLLNTESAIEGDFHKARAGLSDFEKQTGGFETYGVGGKHYAFKNFLIDYGLEPRQ